MLFNSFSVATRSRGSAAMLISPNEVKLITLHRTATTILVLSSYLYFYLLYINAPRIACETKLWKINENLDIFCEHIYTFNLNII